MLPINQENNLLKNTSKYHLIYCQIPKIYYHNIKRERVSFAWPLNTLSPANTLRKAYPQDYDKIIFNILQAKF